MPQNFVKELQTAERTSDGTLYANGCRVHAIHWVGGATAGTVVLKDGGSGGTVVVTIDTPGITTSGPTPHGYMQLPGDGLWFLTDCYLDVTVATACTIFFSPEKKL